jgi:hypothetical protein
MITKIFGCISGWTIGKITNKPARMTGWTGNQELSMANKKTFFSWNFNENLHQVIHREILGFEKRCRQAIGGRWFRIVAG